MIWPTSCISVISSFASLIRLVVAGRRSGNMRRTRLPAIARMRARFTRRREGLSSVRDLLHVERVVAVGVSAVTFILMLALVSGTISQFQNSVLGFNPRVGGAFFVPNTLPVSAQPTATVSSCPVPHSPQVPVSPAVNSHILDETVRTPERLQHQPETSRQQSGSDTVDAVQSGIRDQQQCSMSRVERTGDYSVNQDFLKDEYDYSRFTHDFYEYEQGQKNILVKGRLKNHLSFWRSIGSSDFVLDIIENGYKIPLYSMPSRTSCKNNRSALCEPEFVSEAIKDLLDRGLIEKCNPEKPPYIINPLTVSIQTSGKKRLILDLREVNKHVWKQKFKYEDINVALAFLEKGFHMIKFDITSAYHFIEVANFQTDLLGFGWVDKEGNPVYYKFLVLPFGLNSASYVFSKVCRPLVKKWRGEGKMVNMFLDDGFACAQGLEKTESIGQEIKTDILKSGFVPNATKCIWFPVQVLEFLGVILNAEDGTICIPERRILKAKQFIADLSLAVRKHRRVPVRKVASFVGQIISMSVVIGHVSQIMSRYLSADILNAKHWDAYIQLSCESCEQLSFWDKTLDVLNFKDLFESHKCTKIVYSDASSTGYAGFEISTINGISHGLWTQEEALKSSTWRELVAVHRILLSLKHILANQRIKWFTDNQGVKSIITKGSMKTELQDIAYSIFRMCLSQSISLEIEWIPRSENEKSNYLSKILDFDDWGISFAVLDMIQSRYGALQVDWFASNYNAKLPKFYSRFWNPSCAGVDAFAESWGNQFGLFVPPISIIYRVIKKMIVDRVYGVLVIPCWKSAVFWPFICPNGVFRNEIADWFDLPTERHFYVKCKNGGGLFGNTDLHFRMLALKVDFRAGIVLS